MVQCPNCGVETEENAIFCSLCGEPLLDIITDNKTFIRSGKQRREEKRLTEYQQLTGRQKRIIFWQISGLILISAIIITLLIDFIGNQSITWSRYPATVCLVLFVNFTLNTFLHKKIILAGGLSFLSAAGLFMLFDVYAGGTAWEIKLGVPIILAAYLTVFLLIFFIRKAKQKGLNIIAYSMIAAGVLCICIEGIVSVYARGSMLFGWSLIVMVSFLFVSLPLFYIHYRLKKATDLKRFFHI
ncbi:zinc-ribbon domain-containing protein [Maribellus luteus]|uniref:Zinc-ribbon domain-containing protein n=1 Tax=Maribellus luteus TaxID=2305463 RepID=A0A399SZK5_9BACT|nr:DUF6320 domain-containing protein [Maribellus luteus]RIJ47173.1 zinc-ribbon domain-containing protein [Maribellus luteus]